MHSREETKNYQYTLYNSHAKPYHCTTSHLTHEPLAERSKNLARSGHFTTIHAEDYDKPSNNYNSPKDTYQEPISKKAPYRPSNPPGCEQSLNEKPLTFACNSLLRQTRTRSVAFPFRANRGSR